MGKSALINFLTDGYLPTETADKLLGAEFSKVRHNAYDFALQVAYEGVQSMNNYGVEIQDKTRSNIQDLLKKYKENGGDDRYDNITNLINQNKNE